MVNDFQPSPIGHRPPGETRPAHHLLPVHLGHTDPDHPYVDLTLLNSRRLTPSHVARPTAAPQPRSHPPHPLVTAI